MFLAPPLKSSAAIRAASTEPMPLVSWKMPEISLSTPTRTTLSEISARAGPHAAHDKASARQHPRRSRIVSLPVFPDALLNGAGVLLYARTAQHGNVRWPVSGG